MKHYYITTAYSQGTQVSIQQDHASKEMFYKLMDKPESVENKIFKEYMEKHKTTVMTEIWQPQSLLALYAFMFKHKKELNIPFGIFQEPSMNYTPTCLSFIATTKLCHNLFFDIQSMLRENKVSNLYDLVKIAKETNGLEYKPHKNMQINISFKTGKPTFEVIFNQNVYKSDQNTDALIADVESEDVMANIYEALNKDDFMFYNSIEENETVEKEQITETYSLVEFCFLYKIKSLKLKS